MSRFVLSLGFLIWLGAAAPGAAQAPSPTAATTSQAAPEPAPAESPPHKKQPETLLEFAVAGGWLMIPITASSIVFLAFLVERWLALQKQRVLPLPLVRQAREAMARQPFDRADFLRSLETSPSSAATILRVACLRLEQPREDIEKAVNNTAQREIYQLRRNLRIFAIISSVAPLLGLLGTVTGLVQSFREVASSGLGSGAALAPGIYEALITTVGGLVVAIPALLTYYWFSGRVDHYVHEIDALVTDLVDAHHSGSQALARS